MAGPLEGKSILVVDDDPDIVTAMRAVLSEAGADVSEAVDGEEAVNKCAELEPDLVVLDVMLPKRSGFLVLEKLKGKKKKGEKPFVIMITASQGKRHQVWAETLGVDGYFNKPFRMDRLVGSVEKLLTS